jgi:hypothetical protein
MSHTRVALQRVLSRTPARARTFSRALGSQQRGIASVHIKVHHVHTGHRVSAAAGTDTDTTRLPLVAASVRHAAQRPAVRRLRLHALERSNVPVVDDGEDGDLAHHREQHDQPRGGPHCKPSASSTFYLL